MHLFRNYFFHFLFYFLTIHSLFMSIEWPHSNRDSDFLLPDFLATKGTWRIPLYLRQRRCCRCRCSRHRAPPPVTFCRSIIHQVKQLQQINKKQSSNNSKYSHQHVGSSTKKVEGHGYVPFGNTQSSHVLNEGQHSGI